MGLADARADGVRFVLKDAKVGGVTTLYYPRCHKCGEEVMNYSYRHGLKYMCRECKLGDYLADKDRQVLDVAIKKEQKLEEAVKRIEKAAGKRFPKYAEAIEVVREKLHNQGWFQSTEEIMVAIELLKNKIRATHQMKVGRYRVDFALKELKIVVEVDGVTFHNKTTRDKEKIRDGLIISLLGADWEIVRITDTDLNTDITKLTKAISIVKKEREKYRALNGGILPDWYNDIQI